MKTVIKSKVPSEIYSSSKSIPLWWYFRGAKKSGDHAKFAAYAWIDLIPPIFLVTRPCMWRVVRYSLNLCVQCGCSVDAVWVAQSSLERMNLDLSNVGCFIYTFRYISSSRFKCIIPVHLKSIQIWFFIWIDFIIWIYSKLNERRIFFWLF